jgi:glycosyltransferase involved in cell wall biosynthesis
MTMTSVTVAVSAKDAEKTIVGCLESIKNQTVKPDEIFVIVDDENDSTIQPAKKMGAVVLINKGVKLYDARNTVLDSCKTDILAFTDADCVVDKNWIKNIKRVFKEHPEVVGGTGPHPAVGKHNFSSWLHHMWYIVETKKTGYTNGVIGANSYFRTDVVKKVGGWVSLPIMCAEDVHISKKLTNAGYKLWFDEKIIAHHKGYRKEFRKLLKQSIAMGHDIMVMMKATKERDFLFWYTLMIPIMALLGIVSVFLLFLWPVLGIIGVIFVYLGTLMFLTVRFKSFIKAFPRWFARWVLIWPYSYGVVKGLCKLR